MLSPLTTVFVLAVLWLIVVVPMVLRRGDARRRDRSVEGFGRAMRALGRRHTAVDSSPQAEVFVPSRRVVAKAAAPSRRPVPAAQEALMYPVDRSEMSEARQQMMKRRRRSLTILIAGSVIFGILAGVSGGRFWLIATPFLVGLFGYLYFLRSQALRDSERRAGRQRRASERRSRAFEVSEDVGQFEGPHDEREYAEHAYSSVVRIDDDDLELHNLDTIDLTGLYEEEAASQAAAQRRAS
jgi:hypothetical protein